MSKPRLFTWFPLQFTGVCAVILFNIANACVFNNERIFHIESLLIALSYSCIICRVGYEKVQYLKVFINFIKMKALLTP